MDILRSFSNLFNRKKDEAQPRARLKMEHSSLKAWIEEKREKELGEIVEESTPLITEILSIKANVIDIMKELKERTFPEEMEKRISDISKDGTGSKSDDSEDHNLLDIEGI